MKPPKAFVFDVLGTVVNWRQGLTDGLAAQAARTLAGNTLLHRELRRRVERMTATHWEAIAVEWHGVYHAYGERYMAGVSEWLDNDEMLARGLDAVMGRHGLGALWGTADDCLDVTLAVWHALPAWPDCRDGIEALNALAGGSVVTATLSNGSTALLRGCAEKNALPFKMVLSADDFHDYKPSANVYIQGMTKVIQSMPDKAEVTVENVVMVAAHLNDLRHAKMAGLQTIYIERPLEEALPADEVARIKREGQFVDMWIDDQHEGIMEIVNRFAHL